MDEAFASSLANIDRDHGVGYARCSICSIAVEVAQRSGAEDYVHEHHFRIGGRR